MSSEVEIKILPVFLSLFINQVFRKMRNYSGCSFETTIAEIPSKWNGVIIIIPTGDMNIDVLGQEKESTKRYKDILNSYNLYQHVTKPTRKGKTLIDHNINNIPNKVNHNDVIPTDEINDHDTP